MSQEKVSTGETPQIVGLTGGIASGKSTVSAFLQDLGAHVIDADQVARKVVEPGTPALSAIIEAFGDDVLSPDGTLNRTKLGALVFAEPERRITLNSIVHPEVATEMFRQAQEARAAGHKWVIYDAALLVENQIHSLFPDLIVVAASPEAQIERMMNRDGFTQNEAKQRLESQLPLEEKIKVATFVIRNDGALNDTLKQTEAVFNELCAKYGKP